MEKHHSQSQKRGINAFFNKLSRKLFGSSHHHHHHHSSGENYIANISDKPAPFMASATNDKFSPSHHHSHRKGHHKRGFWAKLFKVRKKHRKEKDVQKNWQFASEPVKKEKLEMTSYIIYAVNSTMLYIAAYMVAFFTYQLAVIFVASHYGIDSVLLLLRSVFPLRQQFSPLDSLQHHTDYPLRSNDFHYHGNHLSPCGIETHVQTGKQIVCALACIPFHQYVFRSFCCRHYHRSGFWLCSRLDVYACGFQIHVCHHCYFHPRCSWFLFCPLFSGNSHIGLPYQIEKQARLFHCSGNNSLVYWRINPFCNKIPDHTSSTRKHTCLRFHYPGNLYISDYSYHFQYQGQAKIY